MEMKDIMMSIIKNPANLNLLSNYLESLFLAYTFVITAIYCVKLSILLFYQRIFFVTTGYRRISLALTLLSTTWYIAAQVANLLTCQPIDSFWHRLKPGKCFNFNAMYLGTGIVDLLIDIGILVLPIRMACKLHLPTRTRVAVAGIFALGGFVVIAQIVRLSDIYQPGAQYGESRPRLT
ncbi:hypothetical protein BDV96DRAFT_675857 [Lophiotrema nucula]|uniref:Rhodopsin domain-containing protein n=1 Tax=Lophiotrema nucula TaxID=690887 RepID=A0A6A5YI86_9PLEO|nr:hypothetical protein BDV96DRAFT_675857 [Lophiotrema nucula]